MLKKPFIIVLLLVSMSCFYTLTSNFNDQNLTNILEAVSFNILNIAHSPATTNAPEFETNNMMFFSLAMMGMIAYRRLRAI